MTNTVGLLDIDLAQPRVDAGRELRGTLRVASASHPRSAIDVTLGYSVERRVGEVREREDANVATVSVAAVGEDRDGVLVLPFSMRIPKRVPTYAGKTISVRWFVRAADLERTVSVRRGLDGAASGVAPARSDESEAAPLVLAAVTGLFLASIPLMFVSERLALVGGPAAAAICVGLTAWFRTRRREHIRAATGRPKLEVDLAVVVAASHLTVRLWTDSDVHLDRADAVLTAEEIVVVGAGSASRTSRHALYSETISLARRQPENGRVAYAGELLVPADAAPTLRAAKAEVSWNVVGIAGVAGDTWQDTRAVEVIERG